MRIKSTGFTVREMDAFIVGFFAGSAYAGMFDDPDVSKLGEEVEIKSGETAYDLAARLLDMDSAYGKLCHTCERCHADLHNLLLPQVFDAVVGYRFNNITSPNGDSGFLFHLEELDDSDTSDLIIGAKVGSYEWANAEKLVRPKFVKELPDEEMYKCIHAGIQLRGNHNPTVEELMNAIG